jgi:hypothetical protein
MSNLSNAPMGHVLTIEVPLQFIDLCHDTGVAPQAALRGLAAMLCGLRYDEHNRLHPLDGDTPPSRTVGWALCPPHRHPTYR